tara:strand:+ start:3942 stop:4679 length:738 start_codon:yes stop_codon:yes gene_type:complete
MNNVSDLNFRRISSFIDGELEQSEVKILLREMEEDKDLKDLYFKLIELSETSRDLKSIGFKAQIGNLSLGKLLEIFTQRLILPITVFSVGAILSYSVLSTALSNESKSNNSSQLIAQTISSPEAKETLESIKNDEILQFASRHYSPNIDSNVIPVAYTPKWIPSGFSSDNRVRNKFTHRSKNKGFSIFINNPNTSNLPDGVYKSGNFVLLKKTHVHGDKAHTIAIFGDIDVESGIKILDSIQPSK